jgi:hypothetical protein
MTIEINPLPCFICGALPKLGSFPLMDLRRVGWTCLCPNRCHETEAYLEATDAIEAWNLWVETEGYVFDDDPEDEEEEE